MLGCAALHPTYSLNRMIAVESGVGPHRAISSAYEKLAVRPGTVIALPTSQAFRRFRLFRGSIIPPRPLGASRPGHRVSGPPRSFLTVRGFRVGRGFMKSCLEKLMVGCGLPTHPLNSAYRPWRVLRLAPARAFHGFVVSPHGGREKLRWMWLGRGCSKV